MDQSIRTELKEIKDELKEIRCFMQELDTDVHVVKMSYIEKLRKIKKDGVISEKEFEKELGIEF